MIEVSYEPRTKLIIHEYLAYEDLDDFVKLRALGVPSGGLGQPLRWAEGVVMAFKAMANNETVTKELLEGKLHWDHVSFALMPKYQREIVVKEVNVRVPVINVSSHPIFKAAAAWLKERFEREKAITQ